MIVEAETRREVHERAVAGVVGHDAGKWKEPGRHSRGIEEPLIPRQLGWRQARVVGLIDMSPLIILVPAQAGVEIQLIGQLPGGIAVDRRALGQYTTFDQLGDVQAEGRGDRRRQRAAQCADGCVIGAAGGAVHVEHSAHGVHQFVFESQLRLSRGLLIVVITWNLE